MTSISPLVIPGREVSDARVAATLASVRGEVGDAEILVLGAQGLGDGTRAVSAEQALAAAELLAPIRPGDAWIAGSLPHRALALTNHPVGALAVAAHTRVDGDGNALLQIAAPAPGTPPDQLLLHPGFELSALLLRSARLTPAQLEWLLQPFGDQVLTSTLAVTYGLLPSGEPAARVLVDPSRHSFAAQPERLGALAGVLDPGAPGASTVRRELLRTTWVEPMRPSAEADLSALLPADVRERADVAPVLEDLSWILMRQSEALAAERLRWAEGEFGDFEPVETLLETNLPKSEADLTADIHRLHLEVLQREAIIDRLEAELRQRDAQVQRIEAGQ